MAGSVSDGPRAAWLQRQYDELQVVESMYPDEFQLDDAQRAVLADHRRLCEADGVASQCLAQVARLSFSIRLPTVQLGGQGVYLRLKFPQRYPQETALVSVGASGASREQHEALESMLSTVAQEQSRECEEAVLSLITAAVEEVSSMAEKDAQRFLDATPSSRTNHGISLVIERCLVWFHHIKSTTKRRMILDWSQELELGGFCKPGCPGVLIFEGEASQCTEFKKRLRALNWKAMSIREEDWEELASNPSITPAADDMRVIDRHRKLPKILVELQPEGGMSRLSLECKAAGLEKLFLRALKIDSTGALGAKEQPRHRNPATPHRNIGSNDGQSPASPRGVFVEDDRRKEESHEAVVYRLDHMRHKAKYSKRLSDFTAACELQGHLLFYKRFIFIFLQGTQRGLLEWHRLMTTQTVDADSRGRPCKERMLRELFRCQQGRPRALANARPLEVVNTSAWDEVVRIFALHIGSCPAGTVGKETGDAQLKATVEKLLGVSASR